MKQIEIKTHETLKYTVTGNGKGEPLSTLHLIQTTLNSVPEGGFTTADIMKRNRIEQAMKEATGSILLEDADYDELVRLVEAMRWTIRDMFIYDFEQDLKKAGQVKVMANTVSMSEEAKKKWIG